MKRRHWDRFGSGGVSFTEIGLCCAALGNLFRAAPDAEVGATLAAALDAGLRYFDTAPRRCCITLPLEDSHRESMRLDGLHEQVITRPLLHDVLVQLHCVASQSELAVDLVVQ